MEARYPYKLVPPRSQMLNSKESFDPWFEDRLRSLVGDMNPTFSKEQGFLVVNFMGEQSDTKVMRAYEAINNSGIARAEQPDGYLKFGRVTMRQNPAINAGIQLKVSPTDEARKQYEADTSIKEWRTAGDPPLPVKRRAPSVRRRPPHDPTYGDEPDLLDRDGTIVEPDVRMKISKYFKGMHLREMEIRDLVREILYIETKKDIVDR